MKSLIVLLLASLSFSGFAKGCFVQFEKKTSLSGQVIRIDFLRNGNDLWATHIQVDSHYPDPRTKDNSIKIELSSKLEDLSLDNEFKKFDYSKISGEVNFMFFLPRGSITRTQGVPGISSGRQIASDWMSFGIKDIQFSSSAQTLTALGGLGSDSRNWDLKSVVSRECFIL